MGSSGRLVNARGLGGRLERDEGRFVVPGPGALDGLSKCFTSLGARSPADTVLWLTDEQHRALPGWSRLFGRPLQPVDVQNLLCELSKRTRITHPDVIGSAGRTRMKRRFSPGVRPDPPAFPIAWDLHPLVSNPGQDPARTGHSDCSTT